MNTASFLFRIYISLPKPPQYLQVRADSQILICDEHLYLTIPVEVSISIHTIVNVYTLTPTTLSQSSNHVTSYAGRWSTSGSRGVTHISLPTQNTIEGTEKIDGQTNKHEQSLGLTMSRGRYATLCIPDSIYGLTLAWVTSENSTKLLESDSSWLTVAGPYLLCYCLPSPVLTAPVRGSTQTLCCSPLCCPAANCSLLGRVVNSLSRPLPTFGYGEISGPKILCLVSHKNKGIICFGSPPT